MRIVVTGTRGIPDILGGVETHCEELFPRIARKDIDVTLIRRKSYVHDSLTEYKGIKLVDLVTPKKKSFEAIIHTFKAILKAKSLHADIVHIHAIGPALVTPLARLLGMKVVFTHHGPDYDRDKWGFAAKTMLRLGERMGCMFANEVIVISEVINDLLVRKYGRRDCHLIYNGVPAPDKVADTDYLNSLGVEPCKYVFAMGRFVPEKNFHQLIRAFAAIFAGCGIHTAPGREENHAARIVNAEFPVTIENYNSEGKKVSTVYQKPPTRIIALWQNSIETLLELGAGEQIIAATGIDDERHLTEENRILFRQLPMTVPRTIGQEKALAMRSEEHTSELQSP